MTTLPHDKSGGSPSLMTVRARGAQHFYTGRHNVPSSNAAAPRCRLLQPLLRLPLARGKGDAAMPGWPGESGVGKKHGVPACAVPVTFTLLHHVLKR